jgi:hypothetical protein
LDATLLEHIRELLDDSTSPYTVPTTTIERVAKTKRREVYYAPLYSDDDLNWYIGRNYVEVTTLADGYEGDAVTPSASDPIEGKWTFATAQSSVYLRGYVYDLLDIVAECWLIKGNFLSAYGPKYSLGDESVDDSGTKEYCIGKYWQYRTSRGGRVQRR